jgi:hypothetical protein
LEERIVLAENLRIVVWRDVTQTPEYRWLVEKFNTLTGRSQGTEESGWAASYLQACEDARRAAVQINPEDTR